MLLHAACCMQHAACSVLHVVGAAGDLRARHPACCMFKLHFARCTCALHVAGAFNHNWTVAARSLRLCHPSLPACLSNPQVLPCPALPCLARSHARTLARSHARTLARSHAHTHAGCTPACRQHTHTHVSAGLLVSLLRMQSTRSQDSEQNH